MPGTRKTCTAKKRDSVRPAMIGPPRSTWTSRLADDRRAGGDGRHDAEAPVGVLVPAQHLAGEGHAERAHEEEDPGDPGHLARILVRAEEEDLDHVQRHHRHHGVGAPEVHGAQQPAEGRHVVEVEQAVVGLVRRRDVDEGETDAGGDLQDEEGEGRAPEHVPPGRAAARDLMGEHGRHGGSQARSLLDPLAHRAEKRHRGRPSHLPGEGGELAPAHPELPVANLVLVLVESARAADPMRASRPRSRRRRGRGT